MIAKISLGVSALLTIAVVYLLLNNKPKSADPAEVTPTTAPALTTEGGPRPVVVAFVNGDSINEKYKFILEKTKSLESKYKSADRKFSDEYLKKEKEANELIAEYQKNPNMLEVEKQIIQQKLGKIEEELQRLQQESAGGLLKEEELLQKELLSRVSKYLENYAKAHGIDYVMNQQGGLNVLLYGNGAYDITSDVIMGLNAEYEAEKKK